MPRPPRLPLAGEQQVSAKRLALLKMRRSAAPSQMQGNSFKKTRFIPPGRSNTGVSKEVTKMSPNTKLFQGAEQSQSDPDVCSSNPCPTEGSPRELGDGARVDPLLPVQTWMRLPKLVPVRCR
ncbi:DNA repair and recombination protein RAD54B isoform X3 [Mastomys coucha]|uniref:DNA repair and recombination protein RAD54B isoform X3 n=1 Tax=Mastomys coucha TaxID=35658 RepID=UPI001262648D|nr:DNA repair and recombination protein RAD54B isoform X3 [Mastomys coucha]